MFAEVAVLPPQGQGRWVPGKTEQGQGNLYPQGATDPRS